MSRYSKIAGVPFTYGVDNATSMAGRHRMEMARHFERIHELRGFLGAESEWWKEYAGIALAAARRQSVIARSWGHRIP